MKTFKDFKDEYREKCTDTWDDALEAWFEAVGRMNKRGLSIPVEWKYQPGEDFPGCNDQGTDPESPWHEDFESISNELLIKIAHFLFRYCKHLEHHGLKDEAEF